MQPHWNGWHRIDSHPRIDVAEVKAAASFCYCFLLGRVGVFFCCRCSSSCSCSWCKTIDAFERVIMSIIFNRTLMPRLHILFEAGTPKVELEACNESVVPGCAKSQLALQARAEKDRVYAKWLRNESWLRYEIGAQRGVWLLNVINAHFCKCKSKRNSMNCRTARKMCRRGAVAVSLRCPNLVLEPGTWLPTANHVEDHKRSMDFQYDFQWFSCF